VLKIVTTQSIFLFQGDKQFLQFAGLSFIHT